MTVKTYYKIFHKDPCTHACTHARTRGVNVCARISSRQKARECLRLVCAHVCTDLYEKKKWVVLYNLSYLSFKFHKDRSVRCGNICKTILTLKK